MSRHLYVNLAVADLQRSIRFFGALGFEFDRRFADEFSTCLIVNAHTSFMLLAADRFGTFTTKPLVDSHAATEAIFALSVDSRDEVDRLVETALASGGSPAQGPQDHGFMYGWSFRDPDGHHFEVVWMDADAMPF